jgi:multidrug resistance efflux pump
MGFVAGRSRSVIASQQLEALDPQQMPQALLTLMAEIAAKDDQLRGQAAELERSQHEAAFNQALVDKLTHELAVLKRLKFAATSE